MSKLISIRIPDDLYEQISKQADEENRTVSNTIVTVLQSKMTEWIPTASKMPDRDQNVLVWLYGNYYIGYLDKDPDTRELRWSFEGFSLYGDEMEAVEAWMPLPKAYNGK